MELNLNSYLEKEKCKLKEEFLKVQGETPTLNILTDGSSKASESYMKSKINMGKELGVIVNKVLVKNLADISVAVSQYQKNKGTIFQLPCEDLKLVELYEMSSGQYIDIDGFFSYQSLVEGDYSNAPCTALGIYDYAKTLIGGLRGTTWVLVGMGNLTNKPLAIMLMNSGATVVTINTSTDKKFREEILKMADVVVLSTGHKGSVKMSELSSNKQVLVFNVGICFEDGKLTTELELDCEKDNVKYTPRINGVGKLTVLSLFKNLLNLCNKRAR